jgi:excisionase family DNA binding protein
VIEGEIDFSRRNTSQEVVMKTTIELLSVDQASRRLQIAKSTIYKLVSAKSIPFTKLGTRVLFEPERLAEWISEHTTEPLGSGRERRTE